MYCTCHSLSDHSYTTAVTLLVTLTKLLLFLRNHLYHFIILSKTISSSYVLSAVKTRPLRNNLQSRYLPDSHTQHNNAFAFTSPFPTPPSTIPRTVQYNKHYSTPTSSTRHHAINSIPIVNHSNSSQTHKPSSIIAPSIPPVNSFRTPHFPVHSPPMHPHAASSSFPPVAATPPVWNPPPLDFD